MTRRKADILFFVWMVALLLFLVLVSKGCAPISSSPVNPAGNAIARIDARAQGIQNDAARLKPLTQDAGQPLLASVGQTAGLIRHDAGEAATANAATAKQLADVTADRDREHNTLGNKIERTVKRFAWILGGMAVLTVILRIVGMFAVGPWGAAASFISTGIIGIFTGGLSIIQTLFDNLWFRKIAPQPARAVEINTTAIPRASAAPNTGGTQ